MASPASNIHISAIIGAIALTGACNGTPIVDDTDDTGPTGRCHVTPMGADSVRHLVLAHPFTDTGAESGAFAVYTVDPESPAMVATGTTFEMRRAFLGEIVFTPDGELGFVAHDDGTIGVFRIGSDGAVTVLDDGLGDGHLYASGLAMDPSGEVLWVTDGNWPDNGGGVYPVHIGCDDSFEVGERLFTTKNATRLGMSPSAAGRALLGSRGIDGGDEASNVHLVDLDAGSVVGSAAGFPDDEASMTVTVWTDDGAYALIGDNSGFSSVPNRVAVVSVDADTVTATSTIDIGDPVWMIASPFDDAVLVASGFENEILTLVRNDTGFELAGGAVSSPLPAAAVRLDRGVGAGLVLFAENTGVRALRFDGEGGVDELGQWLVGEGNASIVGAIGLQP